MEFCLVEETPIEYDFESEYIWIISWSSLGLVGSGGQLPSTVQTTPDA